MVLVLVEDTGKKDGHERKYSHDYCREDYCCGVWRWVLVSRFNEISYGQYAAESDLHLECAKQNVVDECVVEHFCLDFVIELSHRLAHSHANFQQK